MLPTMISCVLLKGCSLRLVHVIKFTLNEQYAKYKLFSMYKLFPLIHGGTDGQSTVWKCTQCNRS